MFPPNHTFGVLLKPDKYGAGDLIHYRLPDEYLRGKDRISGVIAAMRQQLKKQNYHNFPTLLDAFRHYDKVRLHSCLFSYILVYIFLIICIGMMLIEHAIQQIL